MTVKVLIMSGYGINCESESAHAFEKSGAECDIVHINELISGNKKINDYDIIMFPGGFSYGDDTGSGNAYAQKVKNHLWNDILEFIRSEKLILGVCNGFQIITNLGLFALEDKEYGTRIHAMEPNSKNRYICRWVNIKNNSSKCIFTKGISTTHLPIAHGEGKFYCDEETYNQLKNNDQIVFTYCDENGNNANNKDPINPNGSIHDVAGICDRTGRIMGMMPHPERALYSVNEPEYHLKKEISKRKEEKLPEMIESNYLIFKNAVEYFSEE